MADTHATAPLAVPQTHDAIPSSASSASLADDRGRNKKEDRFEVQYGEVGTEHHGPRGAHLMVVVMALLLSMFLIALDMTILATAIPRITDEFDSIPDIGWYAAAFFITLGVFQSSWGKAYKHFNLKLVFLASVSLFEVGSLICGVAKNSLTLIIGRAIAGLGGAGVSGGVYTIMAYTVPPAQVPMYVGLVGAVFSLASVAGPLLGGVFTSKVTWRWAFFINLPIGGLALVLITVFFHTPDAVKPVRVTAAELFLTMDVPGLALSLGLLISFTLAMQWGGTSLPWSSSTVIGLLVGAGVMTLVFAMVQWRSREDALLVVRLMKQRTIWAVCLFIFFLNAANFSLIYNLPQYFQIINGVSATDSGIRNLPLILVSSSVTLASGHVLTRMGYYRVFLVVGSALLTLGAGLVYTLDQTSSIGEMVGYQILVGAGVGACIQVPVTAAQAVLPPQDIAVGTAMVLFFQLVSGAIWVSAAQAILNNRLIATLANLEPNLDPAQVLAVGATEIRNVFQGQTLDHVLQAYMVGLKDSWALATALAGLTFVFAWTSEWRSLKGEVAAAGEA